jgi:two-component system nitrogen regulation sensor histidine kinase GlnL
MTAERAAEAASVGLVLVDQHGRISFANASAETLLGRSRKRLEGEDLALIGSVGEAILPLVTRAMAERRDVFAHDLPVSLDSGLVRFSVDVTPEATGACVSLRPWPEAGASSTGGIAADAAAGFGRMLSHELKNPIAGARGAAQLIAADESGETAELANLIITELDRARRIADRWSQIGDLAPGPLQPVNLHALVRGAVRSASAAAGSQVIWEEHFDPSIPDALADEDLALQAVLNLLKNAAEALGESGGTVAVSTRYRSARPGAPAPEARLEVRVEDDGPGIPERLHNAVFNPFVTGKPAGEGLGLAMVARISDLHGGGVEFESRPGATRFHLYFKEAKS